MSIVTGIQTGIVTGIRTGINGYWGLSRMAAIVDGASLASAMGFGTSPDYGWRGDASSGATILAGGTALTGAGTPTYEQSNAKFNTPVTSFDAASTDALAAPNTTPCNPGATSFAVLFVGTLGADPGANRSIAQCRGGGVSSEGWELACISGGAVRLGMRSSASFTSQNVAGRAGSDVILLGVTDITNNNWSLYTDSGETTGTVPGTLPSASTVAFAIGSQFFASMGMDFALFAYWGVGGEGLNGTHVANLKTFLGW